MYARQVRGQTLQFGVSGMLWERSLVMYDRQTDSLWSHLLGEAMAGEYAGEKLEVLPGLMSDWASWFAAHPETTVLWLPRTADQFRSDRLPSQQMVIGMSLAGKPYAWSLSYLSQHQPLQIEIEGFPLLVMMDEVSRAVRVFDRRVDEGPPRALHVEAGEIRDDRGGRWHSLSGLPLNSDAPLKPVPVIPSYRDAWLTFHPESTLFD